MPIKKFQIPAGMESTTAEFLSQFVTSYKSESLRLLELTRNSTVADKPRDAFVQMQ